jgi:hypothetical protein
VSYFILAYTAPEKFSSPVILIFMPDKSQIVCTPAGMVPEPLPAQVLRK